MFIFHLLVSLSLLISGLVAQVLPFSNDSAAGVIWTFENGTWIENLAVRQNGEVLCTSLSKAALYLVNPFEHVASLVHQFEPTEGLLGISEIGNDVFAVASANVSLATSQAYPGSAKMWKVDMVAWTLGQPDAVTLIANLTNVILPDGIATLENEIGLVLLADAAQGIVWRVDTTTGDYSIAIQDALFTTNNTLIPLGVDGIHILNDYLYFTNFGNNAFGRVAISVNGSATGPVDIIASMTIPDDFAIADDGTAYLAGDNSLYRYSPDGAVDILIGGPNSLVLEGCTSAQLGRTRLDKNVLYIGTNGGLLAPVDGQIHGGQLVAVNVGLFQNCTA
ncbi:hypothetical protein MMC34_003282 [Xylographa carneopallida]|nr:hypothetical protein [Xylographa carneopallida]